MLKYQHEQRLKVALLTRDGDILRRLCRSRNAVLCIAVCLLAACAATSNRAPVVDGHGNTKAATKAKSPPLKEPDWRPASYTVKKGDTLYSIALDHGLDYRELAQWNGLADPNVILVDQVLRLSEPKAAVSATGPMSVGIAVLRAPRAVRAPASATLAQLEAMAEPKELLADAKVSRNPAVIAEAKAAARAEPEPKAGDAETGRASNNRITSTSTSTDVDDDVDTWQWPANGKLLQGFGDNGAKGVDVSGKRGQAVYAAAAGKVVYSGAGLRGYGRLLIIKHNKTYLSAYAHNQQLLVKEGEVVKKGDKIAEMGDSDADQVKLHFEIRRFGKPVDPLKFLPAEKS
jgi:lipoprotein NlpD